MAVYGTIIPIRDNVFVTDINFDEQISAGGIYIPSDDGKDSGIKPRWGRVYAIGKDQQDVKVGEWILMEHGRWTRGILIEDTEGEKTIRRIDDADILMVSDEPMQDETIGRGL